MNFFDRVRDTSVTTGSTQDILLTGTPTTGFQAFATVFATNDRVPYCVTQQSTTVTEWEVGWGTMASTVAIARTQVLASSNGGALVNFGSGTKDVFCTIPGYFQTRLRMNGNIVATYARCAAP